MNAYELADNLIKNLTMEYDDTDKYMEQASNMLRQQADRIAEYEKQIKQQAKEIVKLEIEAQTKPLSDEEIHSLFLSCCDTGFTRVDDIKFGRAIEERHGIRQTDPDLAQYQQQAAQLWNDSCTSHRSKK